MVRCPDQTQVRRPVRSTRSIAEEFIMNKAFATTLALTALLGCGPAAAQTSRQSQRQTQETIRQYILEHPEVIIESLQNLRRRQLAAEQERAREVLTAQRNVLLNDPASPVAGKPDGVTLIEFFDYRCGYCKKVDPIVTELLAQNPNVRVVYKVFPILGPESLTAAKAGLAANKQGAYEQFHKALISAGESITMDFLEKIAGEVGLDFARLKADMASPEVEKEIFENMKLAQALNILATPTFIAGSELICGAVDAPQLQALVAKAEAARKAVDPGADQ